MKFTIVFLILVLSLAGGNILKIEKRFFFKNSTTLKVYQEISVNSDEDEENFSNYLKNFKVDINPSDYDHHKKIFNENYQKILDHNQKEEAYKMGLNKFSHLSNEEFNQFGDATPDGVQFYPPAKLTYKDLPDEWDWSLKQKVTAVQDQKGCNNCYIFSVMAAIESQILIKYGLSVKLSEQEAMECIGRKCDQFGSMDDVYRYAHESGSTYLTKCPYQAKIIHNCTYDKKAFPRVSLSEISYIQEVILNKDSIAYNEEELRHALYELGPIAIGIYVGNKFKDYKSGVFTEKKDDNAAKHSVLLVGYGNAYVDGEFIPYWKIKNSWGTTWGEGGFGRIKRGQNVCRIESRHATVPDLKYKHNNF